MGDARPFIAALVTLDAEALPLWLESTWNEPPGGELASVFRGTATPEVPIYVYRDGDVVYETVSDASGAFSAPVDLAPGEQMRVDTGCIVSMADTVSYDIQFVGGFRNALFGGEGLFYAVLTGPGHVTLQTRPFSRFASRIMMAAGGGRGESRGVGGLGGNILGDLISD